METGELDSVETSAYDDDGRLLTIINIGEDYH
jgi:hypothetical protein